MILKKDLIFNKDEENKIKVIKMTDDNKIYTLDKMVAAVFEKISENKNEKEILEFLSTTNKGKTSQELDKFLKDVVDDLKKLDFLE